MYKSRKSSANWNHPNLQSPAHWTRVPKNKKQISRASLILNPTVSFTKLIRVTSLVLVFVKKLKRRKDESTDQEESLQVYKQAEKTWINLVQKGILNSDKYQEMKSTLALYQHSEQMSRKNKFVIIILWYQISCASA